MQGHLRALAHVPMALPGLPQGYLPGQNPQGALARTRREWHAAQGLNPQVEGPLESPQRVAARAGARRGRQGLPMGTLELPTTRMWSWGWPREVGAAA